MEERQADSKAIATIPTHFGHLVRYSAPASAYR